MKGGSVKTTFKFVLVFVLGFLAYPGLFVPIGAKFTPEAMNWWIKTYAEYLRLWGF
jgi:hypothetical protein